MDKWEVKYMTAHEAELSEALQTLRSSSCFPYGTSIAAMGYYRTGSTLLYNTVRLWAAMGAGESLMAGWMCKDPKKLAVGLPGAPQERCTSVCKDHTWHTGNPEHTTTILMSRRDPFYSVCSRKMMDMWCKMPPVKGRKVSQSEADDYNKRCRAGGEPERNETIAQCHDLMKMQASIYYERVALGKTIAYDVLLEDYEQDPTKEVQAIARGMGICDEAANNAELVRFVVEMGRQLRNNPGADMGITQMHTVHSEEDRSKRCSQLEAWMQSDPECREWMENKAEVTANAELRKMELDPPKRQRLKEGE